MDIIKYYGSDETKTEFINHDSEPLMAVIAHDRSHAVVSLLDEGCEHHLLLAKALDKYNIDEYFRIIFDNIHSRGRSCGRTQQKTGRRRAHRRYRSEVTDG